MKNNKYCSGIVEINNKENTIESETYYFIYNGDDSKEVQKIVASNINRSIKQNGDLDIDHFEDLLDKESIMNYRKVSKFTSSVYTVVLDSNVFSCHKIQNYKFDDNMDKHFHVDFDESKEIKLHDEIRLCITDNDSSLYYHIKGFYPFSDRTFERFEGILSKLEIISLMVQSINEATNYQMDKYEFDNTLIKFLDRFSCFVSKGY